MALDADVLQAGLEGAHSRLLNGYREWGGYRFHGWRHESDPENYDGPLIWSEADCVLRLAMELEESFPGLVHCGVKINTSTRADFPDDADEKSQAVDIAVADLGDPPAGLQVYDWFRGCTYDLFLEVKWFRKGWLGEKYEFDGKGHIAGVEFDLFKLARHLRVGRCRAAAAVIWDDEGFLEQYGGRVTWPDGVKKLIVGPRELDRRGMLQ